MGERTFVCCLSITLLLFFAVFIWALDTLLSLHLVPPESRPMGYVVIGGLVTAIDLLLVARKLRALDLVEGRAKLF